MPNTREKRIELLYNLPTPEPVIGIRAGKQLMTVGFIADHLITNGVTFATDNNVPSKWISVKDRLPEANMAVLVYDGETVDGFSFLDLSYVSKYGITHWMPLPEPPKGE